jgi:hypothetical protein
MPKFFNKNELIILMLIIMLFDLKGFCDVALEHVVNTDDKQLILFFLTMVFTCFSIFVYHTICEIPPPIQVKYKPSDKHHIPTCEEEVQEFIHRKEEIIDEMNKNCSHSVSYGTHLSERIALTAITILLLTFAYFAVNGVNEGPGINPKSIRILYTTPIVLMACCICSFANIYLPLKRNLV